MPRIPTYEQQTAASGRLATPQGGSSIAGGLDTIGRGLGLVADTLDRQREREASAAAAVTVARMQADWTMNLYERQKNIAPGAPDFTPGVLKEFDDYSSKMMTQAKSPIARAFLQEGSARFRATLAGQAMQIEAGERDRHQKQQFGEAIDLAATAAELDTNPDAWKVRLAEQSALLDGSGMGPTEIQVWKTTAQERITARAAVAAARRDPSSTMRRLTTPDASDTLFRSLSPKARDAVLQETESQQRAAQAQEDHAYTMAKRAEAEQQDAVSKDGDGRLANGTLTTQWIERNRKQLSPEDYRYFYRELGGGKVGGTGRGAEEYADLRERASNGEDVRVDARSALTNGQIEKTDYDRLLGEVESTRPNYYKRGTQYLSTVSGYSDLNPTPAAAQTKAAMLDDWDQWARDNPKASEHEAHEAYKRIGEEYAIIDTRKLTLTKRKPTYLVGSRQQPDIAATEQKTIAAFKAGEINQAEFQRQAALLKEWRAAIDATTTQRTPPK